MAATRRWARVVFVPLAALSVLVAIHLALYRVDADQTGLASRGLLRQTRIPWGEVTGVRRRHRPGRHHGQESKQDPRGHHRLPPRPARHPGPDHRPRRPGELRPSRRGRSSHMRHRARRHRVNCKHRLYPPSRRPSMPPTSWDLVRSLASPSSRAIASNAGGGGRFPCTCIRGRYGLRRLRGDSATPSPDSPSNARPVSIDDARRVPFRYGPRVRPWPPGWVLEPRVGSAST
jgi:hypothetical protein